MHFYPMNAVEDLIPLPFTQMALNSNFYPSMASVIPQPPGSIRHGLVYSCIFISTGLPGSKRNESVTHLFMLIETFGKTFLYKEQSFAVFCIYICKQRL